MLWSKAIIRTEEIPDFTSAVFKRAFLEKFDAYPEEVVFEENRIEINFPWETILAPKPFNLMQGALKRITFKKIPKGVEISSFYQRIVLFIIIVQFVFLAFLMLAIIFSSSLGATWPIVFFLLAVFVFPRYLVKRSPVWRFKKLLKSFGS